MHHTLVHSIPLKKYLTEPKETFRRKAVVLQNNTFFLMLEKPCKGGRWRDATVQVSFTKEVFYLGIPIDLLHDRPCLATILLITFHFCAGAICSNIESRRLYLADCFENKFCRLRTVEDH